MLLDLAEACTALHNLLYLPQRCELVPVRRMGEVADLSDIHTGLSKVVLRSKVCKSVNLKVTVRAGIWAILGDDETICAERLAGLSPEDVAFDQHLVVTARVDGLVEEVHVEVVVDVLMTEAASRATSSLIAPVVVVVGDVEMALVDISQRIAVANEGALPMVMEVIP